MKSVSLHALSLLSSGLVLAAATLSLPPVGSPQEARVVGAPPAPVASGTRERAVSSARLCVGALEDQAGGGCVRASSVPQLGMLYPLGAEWMIDSSGRVGVGTTTPGEALDVAGTVRARAGGFRFPDGTLQPSAALPADFEPDAVLGQVVFNGLPCPGGAIPIYSMTHVVSRQLGAGSPAFQLEFAKDVDGCSAAIVSSVSNAAVIGDAQFTVGDDTFVARQVRLTSVEMLGDADGLPREKVTLSFDSIDYDHRAGASSGSWNLLTSSGSASPSFAGQALSFVVPDTDPLPSGAHAVRSTRLLTTGGTGAALTLERTLDVAGPSLLIACAGAHAIPSLEAIVMRYDASAGKDVEYLKHMLSGCQITSLVIELDPLAGWRQTLTVEAASATWDFLVNGVATSAP